MRIELETGHPRLDRFLAEHLPQVPRNKWDDWIREGRVLLNGEVPSKGGKKLKAGDVIETELPDMAPPARHLLVETIDLPTLFEDAQLWIIDKPSGMVVHPGPGHAGGTVVNALLGRLQAALPIVDIDVDETSVDAEEEEAPRGWPGLVHRLDRYTSGCLCLTKTKEAELSLQSQFKERGVEKRYLAMVRHSPKLPQLGSLLIDEPILRHRIDRMRMTIGGSGRPSQTRIRCSPRTPSVALLECEPLTGRTHQIRVHAACGHRLGWPLRRPHALAGQGQGAIELPHPFLRLEARSGPPHKRRAHLVEAAIPEEFREIAARLGLALPA